MAICIIMKLYQFKFYVSTIDVKKVDNHLNVVYGTWR